MRGGEFELQLVGKARPAQSVPVGRQPHTPPLVRTAFSIGRRPERPAAEDGVEDVRVEVLASAEPVGAEGGDDLAGGVAGDAPHHVQRNIDAAPAVEDAEDGLAPGTQPGEQGDAVGAGVAALDFDADRQVAQRSEASVELAQQVLVPGMVLLDEDQVHAPGAEVHAVDHAVVQQAFEDEDGRARFSVLVAARTGESVKERDAGARVTGALGRLQQNGPPGVQVALVQAVLGGRRRFQLP